MSGDNAKQIVPRLLVLANLCNTPAWRRACISGDLLPLIYRLLQRYTDLRFMDWARANHEEA